MARIIIGKYKGKEVEILQFCNDWFSVSDKDGNVRIVNPIVLQLTETEADMVIRSSNLGMMPYLYELTPQLRFKKRRLN